MIKLSVSFKPVSANFLKLAGFAKRMMNLQPLAREVETILIQGNKAGALAGVDKLAKPYAPLKPITLQTRVGDGPPLAPRRASSRVVTNFYAEAKPSWGKLQVTAGWRGEDIQFLKYHMTGYKHYKSGNKVPARNPMGIRPETQNQISEAVKRFFRGTAKASFSTTATNTVE
jgi:phage gpG-like protein